MRWVVALGLLAGCQQIFGLSDPKLVDASSDARRDGPAIDASLYSACTPGAQGFVACFDFNGDALDSSASANQTQTSGITYAPGLQGQALSLDVASTVTVKDSIALDSDAVTIEAWIKPHTFPATGMRMGIWDTDGQYAMFMHASGTIVCTGGNGTTSMSTVAVQLDTWSHVACAIGNGSVLGYINGVAVSSATSTMPIPTLPTNGAEIGGNAPDALERFVGLIDLLRVYRSVRTPAEICGDARCM